MPGEQVAQDQRLRGELPAGVGDDGELRIVEGDPRYRLPHGLDRRVHQRGMERSGHLKANRLGAASPGQLLGAFDGGDAPRQNRLLGPVLVGDGQDIAAAGHLAHVPSLLQGHPDQGGHGAEILLGRLLHGTGSDGQGLQSVLEVHDPSGHQGGVLAERVARRRVAGDSLGPQDRERGQVTGEDGRLHDVGPSQGFRLPALLDHVPAECLGCAMQHLLPLLVLQPRIGHPEVLRTLAGEEERYAHVCAPGLTVATSRWA